MHIKFNMHMKSNMHMKFNMHMKYNIQMEFKMDMKFKMYLKLTAYHRLIVHMISGDLGLVAKSIGEGVPASPRPQPIPGREWWSEDVG